MFSFPEMLISPAKKAGMSVPDNVEDYNKEEFPHWFVYCSLQLGTAMPSPTAPWENAKVIAAIDVDVLKTMPFTDFVNAGFSAGFPIP